MRYLVFIFILLIASPLYASETVQKNTNDPYTVDCGINTESIKKLLNNEKKLNSADTKLNILHLCMLELYGSKKNAFFIVERFNRAVLVPSERYSPYADFPQDNFKHFFYDGEISKFKKDYPWIDALLNKQKLSPRYPALNKWVHPIRISFGLPHNLKAKTNDKRLFKLPYSKRYPEKEKIARKAISEMLPGVASATGLRIKFIKKEDDTGKRKGNLRIVLTDTYDKNKSIYRLYTPGNYLQVKSPPTKKEKEYRREIEAKFLSAVKFVPHNETSLDGFFIPNHNNEIEFATCYIWAGHSDKMIKALSKECLLRSLGVPNEIASGRSNLLSYWNKGNKKHPVSRNITRDDNRIPSSASGLDLFILSLLYNQRLEPGFSSYATQQEVQDLLVSKILMHIKNMK